MIKLIAIDLDGTLLNSHKRISKENQLAIQEAVSQGIKVVLCTGRPIMGIRLFLETLGLLSKDNYCVTFNGGLVQVTGTEDILAKKVHSFEDAQFIYKEFYNVGLPINLIDLQKVYEPTYPKNNPSLYPEIINNLTFEYNEVADFSTEQSFNKIVSCCPENILDNLINKLSKDVAERFTLLKSRPVLLEILPKGVDKGYGLSKLCQYLSISANEVMAIGDEENDLAMLHFAKYSIAMGNATEDVKKIAKYVTDTNDNDGVAKAIRHYALI